MSMELSLKDLTFFGSFFVLFLLVLFLGDSFLFIPMSGLLVAWCLLQFRSLDWSQLKHFSRLLILWVVFLGGLGISSLFAHSLPLTLDTLVFYITSFVVFWFFFLKRSLASEIWHWGWVLIGVVVAIFSLVLLFFPDLGKSLPGTNFSFSIYGHNHSAVILILVLPLSWYLVSRLPTKRKWILPLFITIALITTFARVAILLGLLETLMVFRYLKPSPSRLVKRGVLGLFIGVIVIKIFFSLAPWLGLPQEWCPLSQLQTQICKPFSQEQRLRYWQQAAEGFMNYPLVGYGPGTFQLINHLYRQNPYILTAYTHNTWLQLVSEGGLLVMVPFAWLTWVFLQKVWQTIKSKKDESFFIALGVGSLFINAVFDFDWQLLGVWLATLIFLAQLLKHQPDEKKFSAVINFQLLGKKCWFLSGALVVAVTILFFSTEVLIRQDKVSQAFQVFPFFSSHQLLFAQDYQKLLPYQQKKLKQLYLHHSYFNQSLLIQTNLDPEKAEIKSHIILSDPWFLRGDNNLSFYLQQNDLVSAEQEVMRLQQFMARGKAASTELSYDYRVQTAEEVAQLADKIAQQGDFKKAGNYYQKAFTIEPGVLDKHLPIFFDDQNVSNQELETFLDNMTNLPAEYYGNNQLKYAYAYLQILEEKIALKEVNQIDRYKKRIISLAPELATDVEKALNNY